VHPFNRSRRPRPFRSVGLAATLGLVAGVTMVTVETPSGSAPVVDRQVVALAEHASAGWTQVVELPVAAEMIALTWAGATAADFSVRGQRPDGTWTEEIELDTAPGESPEIHEQQADGQPPQGSVGPAWLGRDLTAVEVTVEEGELPDLALHAIDTEPAATDGVAGASIGMPAAPAMFSRAQWGANESWRTRNAGCGTPVYAPNAHYAIIHHTAGRNDYRATDTAAIVRAIYEFHVFGQGWCDIAYNFLVDRFGQVFEGRFGGIRDAVVGGHTGGFNTGSIGVAVVGDFSSTAVPSATYTSLRRLLAFKLGHHGIDALGSTKVLTVSHPSSRHPAGQLITMPTVGVHSDFSKTDCPGASLRSIVPGLRNHLAADLAGAPYQPRVVGDWDNNGTDTVGTYHDGVWSLRDSNSKGPATRSFSYGYAGTTPVVGDWNGNGRDGIGIFVDGWWLLRNTPTAGPPEIVFQYGYGGAIPVVGNWDGQRGDGVGVYDGGSWMLRDTPTPGQPQRWFSFGWRGPTPVVGDWDGDRRDGIGVWSNGDWSLRETASPGLPQRSLRHGGWTDRPTAGDWDARGRDGLGLLRGAYWYQRADAGNASDRIFWF
jgi:hypothetical protein